MKAADVMVTKVITASPEERVQEVAARLLEHRISGLPVLDAAGKLVGIVSEGDLMRRSEAGTARRRPWWLGILAGRETLAKDFVKANAQRVADIMTSPVITARADTTLSDIATLLERNGIKRVPILEGGRLVGIVSRANLLQALAKAGKETEAAFTADDAELRRRVVERLRGESWAPWLLNVTVRDGTVDLWGIVSTEVQKRAARVAAEAIPGVRAVNDNLIVKPMTME